MYLESTPQLAHVSAHPKFLVFPAIGFRLSYLLPRAAGRGVEEVNVRRRRRLFIYLSMSHDISYSNPTNLYR